MELPFSIEQFYDVFRAYNTAVWPTQVILLALALIAVSLVFVRQRWSEVVISAILALLWLWLGLAYHFAFFATINPLAYGFAALSVAGGLVFVWQGVIHRRLEFKWHPGGRSYAGLALIVFALAVYPAWSVYAGHSYPALPTFGLPCPTTIFTIGLMAFLVAPYPRGPLVVPVLWCLIGGQAVFLLGVPPDSGLFAAAAMGIVLLWRSKAVRNQAIPLR